jgi:predicted ArsR family transcriptional regulator
VETPTGALRVSFQHRYAKLALDREEHLRQVLGDDFDRLFKRTVSLKVKKEVAEDPAQLEQMVMALAEALGADNFASLFEVEQTLTPTKVFTETSCQLPPETRAALNLAGVRQIVALAAK